MAQITTDPREHGFAAPARSEPSGADRAFDLLTTKVARGAFALPFAIFGLFHFVNANAMAGVVPVPGGVFWVYFTGAALVAGAAGIITGYLGKWAALGLAALMLTFVVTVHAPGLANPKMAQMATIGLLKDLALMGGALTWAGILNRRDS
jgi:putative oxidoreductase